VRDDGECLSACYFVFESHGAKIGDWGQGTRDWGVGVRC
jgi:hypothetical protein